MTPAKLAKIAHARRAVDEACRRLSLAAERAGRPLPLLEYVDSFAWWLFSREDFGQAAGYAGAQDALDPLLRDPALHVAHVLGARGSPRDSGRSGAARLFEASQRLRDRVHVRDADLVSCADPAAFLVRVAAAKQVAAMTVRLEHLVASLDAVIAGGLDPDLEARARALSVQTLLLLLGV